MAAAMFDTYKAIQALKRAGFGEEQAVAVVHTVGDAAGAGHTDLATRADLAALEARIEARMYRGLWIQGGAIVAILTALRFLPV